MTGLLLELFIVVLFGVLGVHHFVKARRALHTGMVEGLMIGFGGKCYSRADNAEAFWVNVLCGFFAAALGAIVVLWGILLVGSLISAYLGQPTL